MRKILTRNGPHRSDCNMIPHLVTAQAVGHWLSPQRARFHPRADYVVSMVEKGELGVSLSTSVFSVNYFAVAPHSFTNHMSGAQ